MNYSLMNYQELEECPLCFKRINVGESIFYFGHDELLTINEIPIHEKCLCKALDCKDCYEYLIHFGTNEGLFKFLIYGPSQYFKNNTLNKRLNFNESEFVYVFGKDLYFLIYNRVNEQNDLNDLNNIGMIT